MNNLWSVWGVGVIKSILNQTYLSGVQVLYLLLTDHDLLYVGEGLNKLLHYTLM